MTPETTAGTTPVFLLDGGIGSELERRGFDVNQALWAAKATLTAPELLKDIHMAYFAAGARAATTNTYQASIHGYVTHGSREALWRSVQLAEEAAYTASPTGSPRMILRSCGPYGAFLHDGSEYTGNYRETCDADLKDFHRARFDVLGDQLDTTRDVVLCETIPNAREAQMICEVLREFPDTHGRLRDGSCLRRVVKDLLSRRGANTIIGAFGINCVSPSDTCSALQHVLYDEPWSPDVPLIARPNSGDIWDTHHQTYQKGNDPLVGQLRSLVRLGVRLVGGCCRVTPHDIAHMRDALLKMPEICDVAREPTGLLKEPVARCGQ